MIHKMGYDCQCEVCGAACMYDEVDEAGDCEACRDAYHAQMEAKLRPLYEGEKHAGLLRPQSEINQDLKDAGRGHLVRGADA